MTDKQIHGAVLQSGRIYKAGDEAQLALVLPPIDVDRLVLAGVLMGDWSAPPLTEWNDLMSGDSPPQETPDEPVPLPPPHAPATHHKRNRR